jgi:hypothetical protein
MLASIKKSFDAGVEKIRWVSTILSERMKVEVAVVKLMTESNGLEKEKDELVRAIGGRVYELRGRGEIDVFADGKVKKALSELEKVDSELRELKDRASQIGTVD